MTEASRFLHLPGELSLRPIGAEGLRACLQEEELDLEERIQLCQRDARQLIEVKPDLAWSRAHQAVTLLGMPGDLLAVTDPAARESACLTLAEVCFQLGVRKKALSSELGRPDLFDDAAEAARAARKYLLANALQAIGAAESHGADHLNKVAAAVEFVAQAHKELPGWLLVEITPRAESWLNELDRHMEAGDNPLIAQRVVQILMKGRRFKEALGVLEQAPEPQPKLAAKCHEEVGQLRRAAEIYLELGDHAKALACYRAAPDFAAAIKLVRQIEGHSAAPSLEWLAEMDALLARRPENFNRVMTMPEKKFLEGLLERGLGVQRKKPAAKKVPAAKKKSTPKAK